MRGEDCDEELKSLALDTVGFIASTAEGKRQMSQFGAENILGLLTNHISRGTTKQKVTSWTAIANILRGEPDDVTQHFFQQLNELSRTPILELLFDLIKQPFADISEAAYSVLSSIGTKRWGISSIISFPGFIEYLLDRSVLISKEAKDTRYALLSVLVENPSSKEVVPPQVYRKMQVYVREGPYYVEPQVEVALDRGS